MPKVDKVDTYRVEVDGLIRYVFVGNGSAQDALRMVQEEKAKIDAYNNRPWWRKLFS